MELPWSMDKEKSLHLPLWINDVQSCPFFCDAYHWRYIWRVPITPTYISSKRYPEVNKENIESSGDEDNSESSGDEDKSSGDEDSSESSDEDNSESCGDEHSESNGDEHKSEEDYNQDEDDDSFCSSWRRKAFLRYSEWKWSFWFWLGRGWPRYRWE